MTPGPLRSAAAIALALLLPAAAEAQDSNILLPADTIEMRLRHHMFDLRNFVGSRFEQDRTHRAVLAFPDGKVMAVKWAKAAPGGDAFNNHPRYEIAAYELQKLFLEEGEYVVPPTVARCFPLAWYRARLDRLTDETFRHTGAVLVVLQYWLWNVRGGEIWDGGRFREDTLYARHFANFNILAYLIRHTDSNEGNVLISTDPGNPRVFAVDNGLAFRSQRSDRGERWRRIRVDRLPRSSVERLRAVELDDLREALGVVAQFVLPEDGEMVGTAGGRNFDPSRGIRFRADTLQLGLTDGEIRDIHSRIRDLLEDIAEGRYELF